MNPGITMQDKLTTLRSWYLNQNRKEQADTCPFGKNPPPNKPKGRMRDCSELCGMFPSLGDVRAGCPCQLHGTETALLLLGQLLRKYKMLKEDN